MLGRVIVYGILGAAIGLVSLIMMVDRAKKKRPRAVATFEDSGELWPAIEAWCQKNGYKLREGNGDQRLYQRGSGIWQAAGRVAASRQGNTWKLEGFLFIQAFVSSAELAFDETGPLAKLPREHRKKEFNQLLQQLGQPALA